MDSRYASAVVAFTMASAFPALGATVGTPVPATALHLCPKGTAELTAAIEKDIAARRYPGAAYAISIHGRTELLGSAGTRDIATGAPMLSDSIFRLASMSKPITAAAVMLLVDEGKVGLDDPVSRYLPNFAGVKVGAFDPPSSSPLPTASRPITLRDLLTHTAGLDTDPRVLQAQRAQAGVADTLAGRVPLAAAYPIAWEPGSRFQYSPQTGFDMLSRVVEVVSGQPFDSFLRRRIFTPLRMDDTGFRLTPAQRKRLVSIYEARDGALIPSNASFASDSYLSGAAGLYGTLGDYLNFTRMLDGNGMFEAKRILSASAVRQMRDWQLPPGFPGLPATTGWGLAMRVVAQDKVLPPGSYGWSGAFGTHFWIDPAHHVTAIFMTNMSNAGGADATTARDYERRVMAALSPCSETSTRRRLSRKTRSREARKQ